MLLTTNAVVLKRQKLQDNDVLVTLFTDQAGKLKAIAKGAKNPRSSLAAATQLFIFGEFVFSMEKEWNKIRSVEVLDPYAKYHDDLTLMTYGSHVLELCNFLMPEGLIHHKAFVNLVDTQDALLEATDAEQREVIRLAYELKMMSYAGYEMNVTRCACCNSQNHEFLWFSIENGGIICDKCKINLSEPWQIGKTLPKIIDFMQKKSIKTIGKTKINQVYLAKLNQLLRQYIKVHAGFSGSKSLELLENIRLL